ncbi:hypothetical protein LXL04_021074 [Taraxacum kok-saghyz]
MEAKIGKFFESVGDFFSGGDQIPWCDSDIVVGCEREVAEAEKGSNNEQKIESRMRLSWVLVHSKRPDDVQRGIAMLEASLAGSNSPLQAREKMYLLAVGYYRSGDYSKSRQLVDRCLEAAPEWRQAMSLKKAIEDHIKKDGVIGIGIAATTIGILSGVVAAMARSTCTFDVRRTTGSPSSYSIPLTHDTDSRKSSLIGKLESCNSSKELKQIHSYIIKTSPTLPHQTQQLIYTTIISISSRAPKHAPDITYIHSLLNKLDNPTIDLYNTVIKSFTQSNHNSLFAILFYSNLLVKGLIGDSFTYPYLLKACTVSRALREGEQIHSHVVKTEFALNLYVANALIGFYGVCRDMKIAQKVFDESPERDLVTWTTLIQGYVQSGSLKKGVEVFYEMCESGIKPDEITMVVVISACAKLRDLNLGTKLHTYIYNHDLNLDVYIGNALLDMYLKCGNPTLALKLFNKMPVKNVISWNSMISGLIQQGNYKIAMKIFKKMQSQRVKPDNTTLVGVLNCCANLGTLKQGRAGLLIEAEDFIKNMIIEPDGLIWGALLSACGAHRNVEIGKRAMENVDKIVDKDKAGVFVVMANLYSSENRFKESFKLRKIMKERDMKKSPGCSLIEVDDVAYEFRKGDRSHVQSNEIYMLLDIMGKHLRNSGEIIIM